VQAKTVEDCPDDDPVAQARYPALCADTSTLSCEAVYADADSLRSCHCDMPGLPSGPDHLLKRRPQAASLRSAVLRIMLNIVEDLEEVLDATANVSLPAARAWRAEFRAAKRKVERDNPNMASEFQVREGWPGLASRRIASALMRRRAYGCLAFRADKAHTATLVLGSPTPNTLTVILLCACTGHVSGRLDAAALCPQATARQQGRWAQAEQS